jgi:hypothetical protein
MIPMSCPSCGRRGNVPLDRLNTRMHCKKCDAVFHLDNTGKPVMGEPKSAKTGKAGRSGNESGYDQLDPIGIVASKIAKVPKPVWMFFGAIIGIGVLYETWLYVKPVPQSAQQGFAEKNKYFAKAFLDKDMSGLFKYSTTDSHEELKQLVDTFRPKVGDKAGTGSNEYGIVVPIAESKLPDHITIEVTIQPPAEADGTVPPIFYLDINWQKTENNYYVNGKATLEVNKERERLRKEAEAKAQTQKRK